MELRDALAAAPVHAVAAVDDSGRALRYDELMAAADALAARIGYERRLVLLEGGNTLAWLIAYVACLRGRHPVLIVPAGGTAAIAQLDEAFRPGVRMLAATGYLPETVTERKAALHPDLAVLLSTSGSTGSAKCVRLSAANIAANATSIVEYLSIHPDERGVVNLPTHYSYGLSIVNSHLIAGATLLLTERSVVDPIFWDFCEEHGATSFAGVPHSYDLLRRIDLASKAPSTLRYFTQAGGRLPPDSVVHFERLARENGWRFYVMYGQTEATARMAYLPPELLADNLDCIGRAIPGGRFALTDAGGEPISGAGEPGELVYEGPNVMMGYATSPGDLARDPGPSVLPTGDLAERTAEGLYRITGRLSRFIKIFGNRIGLDDVERLLGGEAYPAIATGIDDRLLVVTRDPQAVGTIAALLRERLKLPPDYFEVRLVDEYPLLASGKIDYASLKASLTPPQPMGQGHGAIGGETGCTGATLVRDTFAKVFGDPGRDEDLSFNALGGDSLNFVLVAMSLERAIPELPEDWPTLSIGALVRLSEQGEGVARKAAPSALAKVDTVRGFACLLVVAFHYVGMTIDDGMKVPPDSGWHYLMNSFVLIRMPLFTAVAGYLYGAIPAYREGYGRFIGRKARQLLVPMVFATCVYLALRHSSDGRREDILWAFLGGYRHLWYLESLVTMFAIVGLLDVLWRPGWRGLTTVILVVPVLSLALPAMPVFHFDGTLFLLPFFVFGLLLYRTPTLLRRRDVLVGSALVTLTVAAIQQLSMNGIGITGDWSILRPSHAFSWAAVLPWVGGCAAMVTLLHLAPKTVWLERVAAYSFTIYLWHPLTNAVARSAFAKVGVHIDLVIFVGGVAASVFGCIAIHLAAMRFPRLSLPVIGR